MFTNNQHIKTFSNFLSSRVRLRALPIVGKSSWIRKFVMLNMLLKNPSMNYKSVSTTSITWLTRTVSQILISSHQSSQCWTQSPHWRCSWGNTSWGNPWPLQTPCPQLSADTPPTVTDRSRVYIMINCPCVLDLMSRLIHGGHILLESRGAEGRCHWSLHLPPPLPLQVGKTKLVGRVVMVRLEPWCTRSFAILIDGVSYQSQRSIHVH